MASENHMDVKFLEKYLEEHPDSLLFARLAHAYLETDRIDEAIKLCEEGLTRHPYYVTGHMVLGKCYLAKQLYDQAEKEFKRVLLFDPKYLAAHKYYGDLMRAIGWEKTAIQNYKKILQIDPFEEWAQQAVGDYIIEAETPETTTEKEEVEGQKEESETITFEPEKSGEEPGQEETVTLEKVAPVTENPEEEDFLFNEGESTKTEELTNFEEFQLDDQETEKFSTILDDIFKDEIEDEEKSEQRSSLTETQTVQKESLTQSEQKGTDETPENILTTLESEQEPPIKTQKVEETKKQEQKDEDTNQKTSGDKIITPTLGEIYAAQGQYSKAIHVFETLLKKHPDNQEYLQKIELLKKKLEESKDAPKD